MRSKWRLTSAPYTCLGKLWTPSLLKARIKKKVLPSLHRRADCRASPYYHQRLQFRLVDSGSTTTQFQGPSYQDHERFPDGSSYCGRGRCQAQIKRPFRGSGGRSFCHGKRLSHHVSHWWPLTTFHGPMGGDHERCVVSADSAIGSPIHPPQTGLFVAKYL